jgi:hypothetical protein
VKKPTTTDPPEPVQAFAFKSLMRGSENAECVDIREKLFKEHWAKTEESIQVGTRCAKQPFLTNRVDYIRAIKSGHL